MTRLGQILEEKRTLGRKILMIYITGGLYVERGGNRYGTLDYCAEFASRGLDCIEIGIPFSDPVMDGPIIQRASQLALEQGATVDAILQDLGRLDEIFGTSSSGQDSIGTVVMTYYNLVHQYSPERFAKRLVETRVMGTVLPDLPLCESARWLELAQQNEIAHNLLAAPTTPDEDLKEICNKSSGFVYAVGILGVTGMRDSISESGKVLAGRIKEISNRCVLVGVGVSSPEQAQGQCTMADGVIVGSAVMDRILKGDSPNEVARFVGELREAIGDEVGVSA